MTGPIMLRIGMAALLLALCSLVVGSFLVVSSENLIAENYEERSEYEDEHGFIPLEVHERLDDEIEVIWDARSIGYFLWDAATALGMMGFALVLLGAAVGRPTRDLLEVLRGTSSSTHLFLVIGFCLMVVGAWTNTSTSMEQDDREGWEREADRQREYAQGFTMIALGQILLTFTILAISFTLDRWMGRPPVEGALSPYP